MARFHFVEDYEALVANLIRNHPLDQAMSMAVGGAYREFGEIEYAMLRHAGLRDGMSLLDMGCGSGRLAHVLGERMQLDYTGIDIIADLLAYARKKCPPDYKFTLHRELSVPLPAQCADMVCAFSLFTHLLHEETYIYLQEIRRVLKPGGTLAFSFLEFVSGTEHQWYIFEQTVLAQRTQTRPHLNMFIERDAIKVWARHLDYEIVEFVSGATAVENALGPLGQSMVILRVPTA